MPVTTMLLTHSAAQMGIKITTTSTVLWASIKKPHIIISMHPSIEVNRTRLNAFGSLALCLKLKVGKAVLIIVGLTVSKIPQSN